MRIVGFALVSVTSTAQTGTNDRFELVRDEDNILVYERWVTFPGSTPPVTAREVKSEFRVRARERDALSLIRSELMVGAWQKHVSEFRIYPYSDSAWYEYSYYEIPWPVNDQDHFLEYTVEKLSHDGIFVTFRTTENDELAPPRKSVSRMTLSGSWYFRAAGDGTIQVTYRILSMPGPLPRFITDPVIRNNLMATVRNFIDVLEKK